MKTIIPATALFVILQCWSGVLQMVSAFWYERLLSRYAGHWLVQLEQVLDLRPLEQACAGFHKGSGKGSAVIHVVPQLVRALLVKYLHDFSYRQTEEQIDCHFLLKWFAGYSLFESPPDHTTLNRFELWVLEHQPRFFFDETLRQIDAHFPAEQKQKQLVDTFAMLARGAKTSLITLLRQLSGQLLAELERLDQPRYQALTDYLDLKALFGQEDEKITPALSVPEREARLQQIVQQVWRAYHWLSDSLDQEPLLPADQQAPLRQWLTYLDKIMADEVALTLVQLDPPPLEEPPAESPDTPPTAPPPTDLTTVESEPATAESPDTPPTEAPPLDLTTPESEPAAPPAETLPTVSELKNKQKGTYRIASYNDLDATYRKHRHDEEAILGYNAAVITSATYIRETAVVTGSTPDQEPLPSMLESQYLHHGFFPAKIIGDMIFGAGKTRALVSQISEGMTELVALLMPYDKRSDIYTPLHFTLSDNGLTLTCPNGVSTDKRGQYEGRGGHDFTYTAKMCRDCPLFQPCRGDEGNPNARRKVFVSFYQGQVKAALEYNRTPLFKEEIKQRPRVERLIYNLTNLHGARRCHAVGLDKANFQLKMAATAFNIRQFIRQRQRVKEQTLVPREESV